MTVWGHDGDPRGVRNDLSGSAGQVVQAGYVEGGVHFHSAPAHEQRTVPQQLLSAPRAFVNRQAQITAMDACAFAEADHAPGRVVVLDGTAGVGKTALALTWAHRVRERFPGGQLYVNLRGYDPGTPINAMAVLRGFLSALGIGVERIPADLDECSAMFRTEMAERAALVVLDNAADSAQVRPLLAGTARCLTVVTSRHDMRSLVAREGAHRITLDLLPIEEAVTVLQQGAGGARTADDRGDLEALAALCARLPLALRIAAERMAGRPEQPVGDLVAELKSTSRLWELLSAPDDSLAEAARSVFAWSLRAMAPPTAHFFRLLAAHPGAEFALPAIGSLTGMPLAHAQRQLDLLVGAHLVERIGAQRYQLHDLLRAYALDHAEGDLDQGVVDDAVRRAVDFYVHTAKHATEAMGNGSLEVSLGTAAPGTQPLAFPDHPTAQRWFETERANLLAVFRVVVSHGWDTTALIFAGVLLGLYELNNTFEDWIETCQCALAIAQRTGDMAGESMALESLGKAHAQSRRLETALEHHRQSLAIRRDLNDLPGQARSTNAIGLVHWRSGHLDEASEAFGHARQLAERASRRDLATYSTINLASAYVRLGRYDEAVDLLGGALPYLHETGQRLAEENALQDMSAALRGLGHLDQALVTGEHAVQLSEQLHNQVSLAQALGELARTHICLGHTEQAIAHLRRAVEIHRKIGDLGRQAEVHLEIARAYQAAGDNLEAAANYRTAAHMLNLVGERDRGREAAALAAACDPSSP
jgi:tetratricopeptide (TPR) repeat protein